MLQLLILAGLFFLPGFSPSDRTVRAADRLDFSLPHCQGFYSPAELCPGRALVLILAANRGDQAPPYRKAYFLDRAFPLEKVGNRLRGVVAVPLGTAAGRYPLFIGDGDGSRVSISLPIIAHDYGEQRLSVEAEMARPTKTANLERIRHDRETLQRVYGSSSSALTLVEPIKAPLAANITSPFGFRRYLNEMPRSPHGGVDYQAAVGEAVPAAGRGRVVLAEELYYSGKLVLIDHGLDVFSLYMHLDEFSCRVGDLVAAGEIIGRSGCSGRVTGPHLHWGIKVAGVFVDPLEFAASSKYLLASSW